MKISKGYVSSFWGSLGEGMELPNEVAGINLNNENSIEVMVNCYLCNEYKLLPNSLQFKIKESFRYGINHWPENDLKDLYNQILPQISLPTNISVKSFYSKVWNLMFNGESLELLPQQYIEIPELDIYNQ
jgi:hypothetical protein